jgi:hypothetical protein
VRKAEAFFHAGWLAAIAAGIALGGISGCGSGDKPAAASSTTSTQAPKTPKKTAGKPGELALPDMVSAVGATKAGPPVELKFALATRPEVGQPMDLEIAVIPRAPIPESIWASFQVADGLEIVDGSQLERVDNVVENTPIRHVVKVIPKRDGIFALTVAVSFVQANQEWTRTFSIPVIAGEGLPEQVAKTP